MSPCHPEPDGTEGLEERLERGIIIGMLRVDAEGYLVCLDFLGSTDNRPVPTVVGGAHLFESEIIESSAQLGVPVPSDYFAGSSWSFSIPFHSLSIN